MALTDITRVKSHIWPEGGSGSDYDTLLASLITEVSAELERMMGRTIAEATYTEYYDGTGTSLLILRQGPLDTLTSLHSVEYSDAGDGSRAETLTEIKEYERVEFGLRAKGHVGLGRIRLLDGAVFTRGSQNYKVVYDAGFASTPALVEHAAVLRIAHRFATRDLVGIVSKDVGGTTDVVTRPDQMMDDAIMRLLYPYTVNGVG